MSKDEHPQPVDPEFFIRRGRRLRSAAAGSAARWIGQILLTAIRRAYIRPYRMTRTPGCGCEA